MRDTNLALKGRAACHSRVVDAICDLGAGDLGGTTVIGEPFRGDFMKVSAGLGMRAGLRALLVLGRLWSRLPLGIAQRTGRILGRLADVVPNRERDVAEANIVACFPDMPPEDRRRMRRQALQEIGALFTEMPAAWFRPVGYWDGRIEDAGFADYVRGRMAGGRGLIIAAPHLGNWEVGLHQLARIAPVTALYRPPRQKSLEPLLVRGRGGGGAVLVPATARGVRAVREALARGEMVAILPDQAPKQTGRAAGTYAPFFGIPAYTMTLIARLARAENTSVLFAFAERMPDGRFISRWCEAPEGIGSEDKAEAAAALNQGVERCVRRCPEQYLWTYKRFFPSPPGTPMIYQRWKKKARR